MTALHISANFADYFSLKSFFFFSFAIEKTFQDNVKINEEKVFFDSKISANCK